MSNPKVRIRADAMGGRVRITVGDVEYAATPELARTLCNDIALAIAEVTEWRGEEAARKADDGLVWVTFGRRLHARRGQGGRALCGRRLGYPTPGAFVDMPEWPRCQVCEMAVGK